MLAALQHVNPSFRETDRSKFFLDGFESNAMKVTAEN